MYPQYKYRFLLKYINSWASQMVQWVKNPPAVRETRVQCLDQEEPLLKEMAAHSSMLAWRIPWTEQPGGLQPMGSRRVGHDWGHGAHRVWNVEADNPTLLGCNKNRPAALCSMLRLQFKVTANSTERNLQKCLEKENCLGKGTY